MNNASQHKDFVLGNMTDDLVDITLKFCTKEKDKSLRFPSVLYDTYVNRIINCTLDIQELVFMINESRDSNYRTTNRERVKGKCSCLEHLIFQAYHRGWISSKQHDKWSSLVVSIRWKVFYWK